MSVGRRILTVAADQALQAVLAEQLTLGQEFQVSSAASLHAATAVLDAPDQHCSAILLADDLLDGDACDFCEKLRDRGIGIPILLISAHSDEADVVRGLDAGANDYITKPFRVNELLARLRAQLRSYENSEDVTFELGLYAFRPAARLLIENGTERKIRLTEKEAAILKFLYRAGDNAVSREVLLDEVWGYNPTVTTHTLETHVYRLRQKIADDLLVTEAGGYRLNLV